MMPRRLVPALTAIVPRNVGSSEVRGELWVRHLIHPRPARTSGFRTGGFMYLKKSGGEGFDRHRVSSACCDYFALRVR